MRTWLVVALLAGACSKPCECPPQTETLAQRIVRLCGKPPRVESWEMSAGLPGEGSAQIVAQSAADYAKFTDWIVCTSKH